MTGSQTKKKLIEVAIPLDAINAESAREKSIRHGHPSTLHLWWARRPLAASRAVLFAQLVDDPSEYPDLYPTESEQDAERERLFGIVERLVVWENAADSSVLSEARAEIQRCFPDGLPTLVDPFAGGGSIPLEGQRLGLEVRAQDLNPVAVLINKALVEIPPRFSAMPPVHPLAVKRTHWSGSQGLTEDVRHYGSWMRAQAEARIGHLYPSVKLSDGSAATPIAWIWARTVTCPNPACGAQMPLTRSFWLRKKRGQEVWLSPLVAGQSISFEIREGGAGPTASGTVGRTGATCLCCATAIPLAYIRSEGAQDRLGTMLMAVAAQGQRRREYVDPQSAGPDGDRAPVPPWVPDTELPAQALGFRVQAYGMTKHADLFTARQLTAMATFAALVGEAAALVERDALASGVGAEVAADYSRAIATYLAFLVSKLADLGNSLCSWEPIAQCPRHLFGKQTISMVWDFAEGNVFSQSSGSFEVLLNNHLRSMEGGLFDFPRVRPGQALQADARLPGTAAVVATDPPYYDNIGYAALSDFFYVWLRASLQPVYPELFGTVVTPKSDELIAEPARHGGSSAEAEAYFERGFVQVFSSLRDTSLEGVPLTLFYAFKQSEADPGEDGLGSTGWSTMLTGLLEAGWMVTATWPVRTEMASRMRGQGANALASSVVLACRPRGESAGVTDRQGLVRALQNDLPGPLRALQKAHIAPVDLRQAAIGPGMAVFSRYSKVVEPDGTTMRVRTALGLINQVLDEVLGEQEAGFDAETRWAVQWFSQFFSGEGPYGVAEQLAVSMNVAISSMVDSGIVTSGGGRVRLLARDEMPADWDPAVDTRTTVWEATEHLVRALETDGELGAARLLRGLGGLGERAQLLAYRLYSVCEAARPVLGGPYNALVAAWPEILRLSREDQVPVAIAEQQALDT